MKTSVKKYIKIAASVLWWAVVVLLAALLISVLGAKFRGKVPQVFGYSVLHIVSGSMEPEIPVGTYILVKSEDANMVEKESIISFYSKDPAIYGLPNTHRVKDILHEDGKILFVTKGDANAMPDTVNADGDSLIGVFVTELEGLTGISNLMRGKGFFLVIIGLQVITVGFVAYSMVRKKENNDKQS